MDIENVEKYDNFSVTTFQKSVKMSTYLLTFVITNFEGESVWIDTKGVGEPFKLTIFGEHKWKNATKFSLKMAKVAVEYLIEYFDEPYRISKLDLIGVPREGHPATETWGLITFSASSLFSQGDDYSQANVAYSIAHEVAHQWLGNLVTMKWWDNVWLNEGFATFMGFKVIASIQPELDIEKHLWGPYIEEAMNFDASEFNHPIIQVVSDTKAKERIFDPLSYTKPASVLSMLESYIGEVKFRLAIRNYLKKFAFGNVDESDFMEEVQNVSPERDVRTYLKAWTEKPGYPLVNIEKTESGRYKLTQSCYTRTLSEPTYFDDSENSLDNRTERDETGVKCKGSWPIPITYVTDQGEIREAYLLGSDVEKDHLVLPNAKWIKLNSRRAGFYRVNYSREMWFELSEMLTKNISALSYIDRLQLRKDASELLWNGHLEFDVILELLKSLQNENDPSLWMEPEFLFEFSDKTLNAEERASFRAIFRTILDAYGESHPALFSDLIFEGDTPVIRLACAVSSEQCVLAAKKQLELCVEKHSFEEMASLPEVVRRAAINSLSKETWLELWELCKKNWDDSLYRTLIFTDNLTLIIKLLDEAIRLENVEDLTFFVTFEAVVPTNFTAVWRYLLDNYADMRTARPGFDLSVVVRIVFDLIVEDDHMTQLRALLDKYPTDDQEEEENRHKYLKYAEGSIQMNKKIRMFVRSFLAKQ